MRGRLETLWANSERLEMLASKEPVVRRQAARSRVDQLKGDIQHLGAALQSLATRREARKREVEERELLLTTEFTTNAASRESETSIMIDRALEHQAALGRTNRWSLLLAKHPKNWSSSYFVFQGTWTMCLDREQKSFKAFR